MWPPLLLWFCGWLGRGRGGNPLSDQPSRAVLGRGRQRTMTPIRPIRVLHLRDSPWVDGPGRTILESAVHFDKRRVEYHVGTFCSDSTRPHPMIEAARQRSVTVHEIADSGGFDFRVVAAISRLIAELPNRCAAYERHPDKHLWFCLPLTAPAREAGYDDAWLDCEHTTTSSNASARRLLRQFDAVVMVSNAMRRLVPGWWLPPARVTVIHNALVVEAYGQAARLRSRRRISTTAASCC